MSETLEFKTCPFCGQHQMCEPETDVREVCECSGAETYRVYLEQFENRRNALLSLCGKDCAQIDGAFSPVSAEILDLLENVLQRVVFREIGGAVVTLQDGTVCELKPEFVARKASVKVKMTR